MICVYCRNPEIIDNEKICNLLEEYDHMQCLQNAEAWNATKLKGDDNKTMQLPQMPKI